MAAGNRVFIRGSRKQAAVFVIAVSLAAVGCHTFAQKSPADVLRAAYLAANEGRYAEAEQYLSPEVIAAIQTRWANRGGVKGAWDYETKNGTIERIEIIKEDIHGDQATLFFRLHFKDESTKDDRGPLVRQNGAWKIAPAK